jgi:recombination protein RecA
MYDCGISREGSVIDVATDLGALEKKGSWLGFEGQQLGQGREATKEFLRATPAVLDKIIEAVKVKVSEGALVGKRIGGTEE